MCGTPTPSRADSAPTTSEDTSEQASHPLPVNADNAPHDNVGPSEQAHEDERAQPRGVGVTLPEGHARRLLVWETRTVMFAFLVSGVVAALLILIHHASGVGDVSRFPQIVSDNQVLNMLLGMLDYVPVLSVVPLAIFLLARTGQSPSVLGIGVPTLRRDIFPALGLGAAAFGVEIALLIPFAALIHDHPGLVNNITVSNQPKFYLVEGIFMSAVSAVTEEVLVNGYLITRLGQLGWTPRSSLILSLSLRTSYHVYYGLGFFLTIPLGFFVTRSFQKHHRLTRPIVAHFLYDAILFSFAILA